MKMELLLPAVRWEDSEIYKKIKIKIAIHQIHFAFVKVFEKLKEDVFFIKNVIKEDIYSLREILKKNKEVFYGGYNKSKKCQNSQFYNKSYLLYKTIGYRLKIEEAINMNFKQYVKLHIFDERKRSLYYMILKNKK